MNDLWYDVGLQPSSAYSKPFKYCRTTSLTNPPCFPSPIPSDPNRALAVSADSVPARHPRERSFPRPFPPTQDAQIRSFLSTLEKEPFGLWALPVVINFTSHMVGHSDRSPALHNTDHEAPKTVSPCRDCITIGIAEGCRGLLSLVLGGGRDEHRRYRSAWRLPPQPQVATLCHAL